MPRSAPDADGLRPIQPVAPVAIGISAGALYKNEQETDAMDIAQHQAGGKAAVITPTLVRPPAVPDSRRHPPHSDLAL